MPKRPISYTSRDFESIKESLVNYTKRYYSSTFKDFNEASFGSLMLDLVSYVGDQLSFYVDYQANESFLDSALEYESVVRIAKQLGHKMPGASVSTGKVAFYILVPASSTTGGPDTNYMPILEKGATLTSQAGAVFTLIENVDFSRSTNEITVGRVDSETGVPTFYAVKAYGTVISGQEFSRTITVGGYQRFLRLPLEVANVSEVVSVTDTQGNEYFEVENLTQDVVLTAIPNKGSSRENVPNTLKVMPVPRRFVVEYDSQGETSLQFGYGSEDNLTGDLVADPADVVLQVTGRDYITEKTFDPTNLIKTDKFGVNPVNTTLTVVYRANNVDNVNAPLASVNNITSATFLYNDRPSLIRSTIQTIEESIEVENEEPILGDSADLSPDEIRSRAYASFASQNRAVTSTDYSSIAYRMPSKFGKIKRVNVVQDPHSLRRNLNMYVLSEDSSGDLVVANSTIKENLKTWLGRFRMISDTVDILDADIINYGINFEVIPDLDVNKFDLLNDCNRRLQNKFTNVKRNIGEPVYISEIFKLLNDVPGVVDTVNVELVNKVGGAYSDSTYDMKKNISDDGRFLIVPESAVVEILFPDQDISGVIK